MIYILGRISSASQFSFFAFDKDCSAVLYKMKNNCVWTCRNTVAYVTNEGL